MRAVLKLGGSLLYSDTGEVNLERIRAYADTLTDLIQTGHRFIVIVGGGRPARAFVSAARALGANEAQCDWLGIKTARLNAELFCAALGDLAYPKVVDSLDELETGFCTGRVVLMGGLTPGQSTNAVAALAAELVGADMLLNATNVDGVYDKDPKSPDARRLDMVSIRELEKILSGGGTRAGEYRLFDPVAIRVVARSRIRTVIFDGRDPQNLARIISGERVGTIIVHEAERVT
ncbi:MAG TPA: UMP kinase [Candidatus Thorarchaeota archaeon]|nr:MAG: UMP kinase [Candidatus Thorarchaeota archaeon]RLI62498.1 MAG: UMP kinase [Candidatus Thorarchaeota archaeon]HDD67562.1 UMP kinase [Candidatus Thorarchaeota archaeon]